MPLIASIISFKERADKCRVPITIDHTDIIIPKKFPVLGWWEIRKSNSTIALVSIALIKVGLCERKYMGYFSKS